MASFSYRQGARRVAPAGLWFRFGHWYLVAWDLDRAAVRTFRVDRIEDAVHLEAPGGAVVPEGIDIKASLPDEPWRAEGDDYVVTRIRVDRIEGPRVAEEVGRDRVESQRRGRLGHPSPCGWPGFPSIRSWILGLLDHAEILDPPEFRSELQGVADRPSRRARRGSRSPPKVRAVPLPALEPEGPRALGRYPGGRPANGCGDFWLSSDGWPRWGRRRSPTWRAASPWTRTS